MNNSFRSKKIFKSMRELGFEPDTQTPVWKNGRIKLYIWSHLFRIGSETRGIILHEWTIRKYNERQNLFEVEILPLIRQLLIEDVMQS